MKRAKGTPTPLNLFALADVFGTTTSVTNAVRASHVTHVRRCLKAGLLEVSGNFLNLTPKGIAALHAHRTGGEMPNMAPAAPVVVKPAGVPTGFREGTQGELACPHRDLSCCAPCVGAHEEIVEIYAVHYWVPDEKERAEHRRLMNEAQAKRLTPPTLTVVEGGAQS